MKTFRHYLYPLHIAAITAASLLFNILGLHAIGLGIFFVTLVVLVALRLRVITLLPLLLFAPFIMSGQRDFGGYLQAYYLAAAPVLLFDMFRHRRLKRFGSLGVALILLVDVAALSLFGAPSLISGLEGLLILSLAFLVYLYLVNTFTPDERLTANVSWLFTGLSAVVLVQMFMGLYQSELGLFESMRQRDVNFAWIRHTELLYINLLSIPLIGYLMTRYRFKLPFMLGMFLAYVPFMLLLDVIAMMSGAVLLILCAVYVIHQSHNRLQTLIEGVVFAGLTALVLYLVNMRYDSVIWRVYDHVISRDFTTLSELTATFSVAWQAFLSSPIVGTGGIRSSIVYLAEEGLRMRFYQNVFLQALTLGTVGFLAFVYLQYRKVKLLMKTERRMRYFVLSLLFVAIFIQGAFDAMYFHYIFLVAFFLVLAALEVNVKAAVK